MARSSIHRKRSCCVSPLGRTGLVLTRHTAKAFDADLQELVRSISEMGRLAERQIIEAIESLSTRDYRRAGRLVAADDMIDAMQHVIEERAVATSRAGSRWPTISGS